MNRFQNYLLNALYNQTRRKRTPCLELSSCVKPLILQMRWKVWPCPFKTWRTLTSACAIYLLSNQFFGVALCMGQIWTDNLPQIWNWSCHGQHPLLTINCIWSQSFGFQSSSNSRVRPLLVSYSQIWENTLHWLGLVLKTCGEEFDLSPPHSNLHTHIQTHTHTHTYTHAHICTIT